MAGAGVGAGFAAGVLAGSAGAFGYSFSCPEASIGFVAVWYTLGIVLTGVLGSVLGWRVLRFELQSVRDGSIYDTVAQILGKA